MADNKSYYSDDAINAKLSSLNEAQDVIVNVAQWLLFNRRNAVRTADLWMQRVKDSQPAKRLSLIYLANEIVQQSKARKKDEFVNAFSPHMVEATSVAYRTAPADIQQKLKRVVEVWRARYIFDQKTQAQIEGKLQEIDRARASKTARGLGGSLFESSVPSQLRPLVDAYSAVSQAESKSSTNQTELETAETAFTKSDLPLPQQSAHLSALLQTITANQSQISAQLQSRQSLITALDKLLSDQQASLTKDQTQLTNLNNKQNLLDGQKRHVEDMIIRGISSNGSTDVYEPPRPDAEPLTPPPMEEQSSTPIGSPKRSADAMEAMASIPVMTGTMGLPGLGGQRVLGGIVPLSATAPVFSNAQMAEGPAAKRRKVGVAESGEFAFDIDPEVAAMLAK